MRFARTCYDHLAGRLAVAIAERLHALGALATLPSRADVLVLAPPGVALLTRLGVEGQGGDLRGRTRARPCLDWSERPHHLGGALGATLLASFERRGWIARTRGSRVVTLTRSGRDGLARWIDVDLAPPAP